MEKKRYNKIISLIFWYLPVLFVQLISANVTVKGISPWYKNLEKGWWTPPNWVFGPAWTLLYGIMTVAVWLVYQTEAEHSKKQRAYFLFFTQLLVNGLWSFLFFGLQMKGWALIDLGSLIFLILATTYSFFQIRPLAALLLIPYLLWTIYAFTLNAAIWWLN